MTPSCTRRQPRGFSRPVTSNEPAFPFSVDLRPRGYGMFAAHTHSNIELNYVRSGRLVYLHGGEWRAVEAGCLAMFWGGVPHQSFSTNLEGIWISLPLPWFLQWKLPGNLAGRLLTGGFFEFEIDAETPERWLADFSSCDSERNAVLLVELQATLARFALKLPPAPEATPPQKSAETDGGDVHISGATAYIAAHYDDSNLTLTDIATAVKLNPNYLATIFKHRCHLSVWEYVTRMRISHAQRLLATTDATVLHVALESGYSSLTPFYHAFARHCGLRPLEFRRRQRARV